MLGDLTGLQAHKVQKGVRDLSETPDYPAPKEFQDNRDLPEHKDYRVLQVNPDRKVRRDRKDPRDHKDHEDQKETPETLTRPQRKSLFWLIRTLET